MKKIKLFDIAIDEKEIHALIKTAKSKLWATGSGVGNVLKFEKKFKN